MAKLFPYPIVICAFNRPEYFERLISSIDAQELPIDSNKLHVLLDGYENSLDQLKGKTSHKTKMIEIVNKTFPDSHLHEQPLNMGIARIHYKALNQAFSENPEWALILEDDVVLTKDALRFLQEIILQELELPTNTAIINLDCWKRINHKYKRGNFVASHGTRAFLISQKFHAQILEISKIYLEYFNTIQYRDKNYADMIKHMLPTKLFLPGKHSDEFYSSLVDHFGYLQFAPSKALAHHIGVIGENENGILSEARWVTPLEDKRTSADFRIKSTDLIRIKFAHSLSKNFTLSFTGLPIMQAVKFQGFYRTFLSISSKFLARIFRLFPL
jgi:hypothetical protein